MDSLWMIVFSHLDIQQLRIVSEVSKGWNGLAWKSLRKIDMRDDKNKNLKITDESIEFICKHCKNLQYVGLRGMNALSVQAFIRIALELDALRYLDLSWCKNVTDDVITALVDHWKHAAISSLYSINLSFCYKISDQAMKTLCRLQSIERLDINWCSKVTDTGLTFIGQHPKLAILHMNGCNNITDAGLVHLHQLPLRELELKWSNKITSAGIEPFLEKKISVSHITFLNDHNFVNLDIALSRLIECINSDDFDQQIEGVSTIRRILSLEKNPPLDAVVKSGVAKRLTQFLTHSSTHLQFESAWALTNIASGASDHTRYVVELGCVPIFVNLLSSHDSEVRMQAAWALGNVAGDSPQMRDYVLKHGALSALLKVLDQPDVTVSMARNGTWTISNLCRGRPQPNFETVKIAIPFLAKILNFPNTDTEVLTDCCWALSYLSDGGTERIEEVLQSDAVKRLIELTVHAEASIATPALRTLGNIATGADAQTQSLLDSGFLSVAGKLLTHGKRNIRKEALWTISNITAGCSTQIQAVVDAGVIPQVAEMALLPAEFDVRKEAVWAIGNATSAATTEQVDYLIHNGCAEALVDALDYFINDPRMLSLSLESIENIMKVAQDTKEEILERYINILFSLKLPEKLEALQNHTSEGISFKATSLLSLCSNYCEETKEEADGETLKRKKEEEEQGEETTTGGEGGGENTEHTDKKMKVL